jgi:hypothetical protein
MAPPVYPSRRRLGRLVAAAPPAARSLRRSSHARRGGLCSPLPHAASSPGPPSPATASPAAGGSYCFPRCTSYCFPRCGPGSGSAQASPPSTAAAHPNKGPTDTAPPPAPLPCPLARPPLRAWPPVTPSQSLRPNPVTPPPITPPHAPGRAPPSRAWLPRRGTRPDAGPRGGTSAQPGTPWSSRLSTRGRG